MVSMEKILLTVAEYYGLAIEEVKQVRRRNDAMRARCAFYQLGVHCGCGRNQMGKFFGIDHSSVIYGLKQVDNRTFPGIEQEVKEMLENLKAEKRVVREIYSRKKPEPIIFFVYGENQDCCGMYKMQMV
jgi:chromosomal replication initiation ATPase DnaA